MKTFLLILIIIYFILPVSSIQVQDKPVGWLVIPSIDLWRPLQEIPIVNRQYNMDVVGSNGAGWLEETNWITDDWGTVVLAGHSNGAFERLDELYIGDYIYLYTLNYKETYEVVNIYHNIDISETQWLAPSLGGEQLTLITCEGYSRLVVVGFKLN
jgi:LPXTG-site transpeptidase (sortase) family protein